MKEEAVLPRPFPSMLYTGGLGEGCQHFAPSLGPVFLLRHDKYLSRPAVSRPQFPSYENDPLY